MLHAPDPNLRGKQGQLNRRPVETRPPPPPRPQTPEIKPSTPKEGLNSSLKGNSYVAKLFQQEQSQGAKHPSQLSNSILTHHEQVPSRKDSQKPNEPLKAFVDPLPPPPPDPAQLNLMREAQVLVNETSIEDGKNILGIKPNFPNARRPTPVMDTQPLDIFGNPVKQYPPTPPPDPAVPSSQRGSSAGVPKTGPLPIFSNHTAAQLQDMGFKEMYSDGKLLVIQNKVPRGRPKGTAPPPKPPAPLKPPTKYVDCDVQVGTTDLRTFKETEIQVLPEGLEARHPNSPLEQLRRKVLGVGGRWGVRGFRVALYAVDCDKDNCVDRAELIVATQRFGCTLPVSELNQCVQFLLHQEDLKRQNPDPFAAKVKKMGLMSIDTIMMHLRADTWTPARQKVCNSAFQAAQKMMGGSRVSVAGLCKVIKVKEIPTVVHNAQTENAAFMYFAMSWLKQETASVEIDDWMQFWRDVSPGLLSEENFVVSMQKMWSCDAEVKKKKKKDDIPDDPEMPEGPEIKKAFKKIDFNHNGTLSLAELDKAVMLIWPTLNNKPAIMRAYKLTDEDKNGWVSLQEFPTFLKYVVIFNRLFLKFQKIDTSGDRRINWDELRKGKQFLELGDISDKELRDVFDEMDDNGGGEVLFDEFCMWIAKRIGDSEMAQNTNQFNKM